MAVEHLVIIPTYNERENIVKMIETVFSLPQAFHILIVDDSSPDGTADLVKDQQNLFPTALFLLERKGKLGLGTAYIEGFKWGLERGYEYLFEMDCDFSHDPDDLLRLRSVLASQIGDVVVGSRYVKGGKLENWPAGRILISRGASLYVQSITWMAVKDATAGFVGYRRRVLDTINLDRIRFIGYAFQIEMKFASWQLGFNIKEIPITFTDRVEGTSKMSKGIIAEAIFGVIQMKWQSFFKTYARTDDALDLEEK